MKPRCGVYEKLHVMRCANDLPDIALAAISAGLVLVRWETEIEPVTVSEGAEPGSSGEH
jgi:hypothetical protein